jgi:hypothetical protein
MITGMSLPSHRFIFICPRAKYYSIYGALLMVRTILIPGIVVAYTRPITHYIFWARSIMKLYISNYPLIRKVDIIILSKGNIFI